MKYAGLVNPFVSMRAKEIALCLQQIGRQSCGTVTVEVGEGGAESRNGNAMLDGGGNGDAPIILRFCDDVGEIGIEEEVVQRGVALIRIHDAVQEFRANDATAAPDRGDVSEVEVPVVLLTRSSEQFHSLCVRNDLGGVERVAHGINEFFAIDLEFLRLRVLKNFRSGPAVFFAGR